MPAYYLEILVLVLGFTMLGWESFSSSRSRAGIANLGVAGLLIAFLFLFTVDGNKSYWNIYHFDNLAAFYKGIIIPQHNPESSRNLGFFLLSKKCYLIYLYHFKKFWSGIFQILSRGFTI